MLCGLRGVFLLDKQGRIRWTRVGEGDYDEAERLIQKLLAEKETRAENRSNTKKSEEAR